MSNSGKIRVPVVDKNGKETHVWKSPDEIKSEANRASGIPITAAAPPESDRKVLDSSGDFVEPMSTSDDSIVKNPFSSTDFSHSINLASTFRSDLSLSEKAEFIADEISDSDWFAESKAYADGSDFELSEALEELREAGEDESPEAFDAAWNSIYNIADNDKVWLETE